ncbi:MAG: ABC transporter ATP-binding protein [Acidimicrobiales bacterium]
MNPAAAVETRELAKRYGRQWALQGCDLEVPEGCISALVGPNGAGKTTLLRILAGLSASSGGAATVLGNPPGQTRAFLESVGYLAQELPLYRRLSAADHLDMGRHLNPRWDDAPARARLDDLDIPLERPVGRLSGGQRAQVALALALSKRPGLLLLDEPVAALDPLARGELLSSLATAVASGGLTVILSSHLLRDLEGVCDHLILLAASRVQLCAPVDSVLAAHRLLVGPRQSTAAVERRAAVVAATHTSRQSKLLVRFASPEEPGEVAGWESVPVGLEEVVLAYMRGEQEDAAGPLTAVGAA